MKTLFQILLAAAVFLILSIFTACSGEITGTISIKGSGTGSYLALTTDDAEVFKITGEPAEELRNKYQGSHVRLKGRIVDEGGGPFPPTFEAEKIIE